MKPGKPLQRGKPLTPDPEKVREFLNRGRGQLERVPLRSKPKVRPVEGPLSPAEWRKRVFDASEGLCIISGARARGPEDRRFHAHHILAKRILRDRRLYAWVWDPRNGLWLRRDVHARHELAIVDRSGEDLRIAAELLSASVWEFCAELDSLEGSRWATDLVLRAHPARGARGHSQQEVQDGAGSGDGDRPEGD